MTVAGVVLGAGSSERMGRRKQALPFAGTTLLGWVLGRAEESRLDEIVVVVAPGGEPPLSRARAVVNDAPDRGTMSSLLSGVDAVGPVPVMVLLGDTPGVSTADIDRLLQAWLAEPRWAVVARYEDGPGHPMILSPELTASLRGREGDKVLWPMLEEAPRHDVVYVEMGRPRPRDVNTPDDYVAACREMGFEPG
jgi:molybdenum cofactor cytidylyltransferase